MGSPCGAPILWGISPDFSGLSPCYRWIAYVLLTRAPVADKGIATSSLPLDLHVLGLSLAFILSQDQTLRCIFFILYYTFEALPDRIDFFLSYFLYYTCFFNFLNELLSPTAAPWPPRFAKVLQRYCLSLLHSKFFYHFFMLYNMKIIQYPYFQLSICKKKFLE